MSLLTGLSPALLTRLSTLKHHLLPHTSRAYIVGGAVRDLFLGNPIKDLDIEVYDMTPEAFDELMKTLGAKGVGKSFFVYKYEGIDLSLPRTEQKTAKGHQGFCVEVCQEERLASSRRDFTMNALMVHLFTEEVVDFWGGRADIHARVIRMVDPATFAQDPLRVLRGVQFAARFGFHIAPQTLQVMRGLNMSELSQTRITWELEKLFRAPFVSYGVLYMYRLGFLKSLLHTTPSCHTLVAFSRALKDHAPHCPTHLRPYLWLFFASPLLGLDTSRVLSALALPLHYHRALLRVPFGHEKMSDYELVEVAFERPLNTWVGVCRPGYVPRAKALGVYERVFDGGVSARELLAEGFSGKALGEEKRKRIQERAKILYM
ncbi:MAG: CCA tRNA nucleotidyltransferase [Campylobacterales bacterium]|nr:CCA tRNA nucleotidyltransferase [Campylobacterales bacterium]